MFELANTLAYYNTILIMAVKCLWYDLQDKKLESDVNARKIWYESFPDSLKPNYEKKNFYKIVPDGIAINICHNFRSRVKAASEIINLF